MYTALLWRVHKLNFTTDTTKYFLRRGQPLPGFPSAFPSAKCFTIPLVHLNLTSAWPSSLAKRRATSMTNGISPSIDCPHRGFSLPVASRIRDSCHLGIRKRYIHRLVPWHAGPARTSHSGSQCLKLPHIRASGVALRSTCSSSMQCVPRKPSRLWNWPRVSALVNFQSMNILAGPAASVVQSPTIYLKLPWALSYPVFFDLKVSICC